MFQSSFKKTEEGIWGFKKWRSYNVHILNTIKKRRAVPSLTSRLLKIKFCQLYFLFDYRVLQQLWMPHALSLEF